MENIYLLVVPRGRDRLCTAQVWFRGGQYRSYLIIHRPPKANAKTRTPGGWAVRSFASTDGILNAEDLRNEDGVTWAANFMLNYPMLVIDKLIKQL